MDIIYSLDCYNIVIENNKVSNSAGSGIMFSRNMTNSIARNNYVHNEEQCIFVSQSHDNKIYYNTVSNCGNGIYLKSESSNNSVFNNTIRNVNGSALLLNDGASDNSVYSNTIVNPPSEEEVINNKIRTTTHLKIITSLVLQPFLSLHLPRSAHYMSTVWLKKTSTTN